MNHASSVPTLAEWAGGPDVIAGMIERFYAKVPSDPVLAPVFEGMDPRHAEHVARFLTEVLGGPRTIANTAVAMPT